jgi:hypothetical protein
MATKLRKFTEAYASMTVATYEPLILNWISLIGIRFLSDTLAEDMRSKKFLGRSMVACRL